MQNREKSIGGIVPRRSTALVPHSDDDMPIFARVLRNSFWGLAVFVAIGIILLSAVCGIAYSNADPDALIMPLSLASLLPSMFVAGFVCAKKTGEAPLLCGIVCGGVITLCTMLLALILRNATGSGYELWQQSLLHGIAILFCVLGAFAGNVKKKADPRKHKRFK